MKKSKLSLKAHYERVAELGCCITGSPAPQLHHVSGGSMKDWGHTRGISQRGINEYWVIPLRHDIHAELHHNGVRAWEKKYSEQYLLLQRTWQLLGYEIEGKGRRKPFNIIHSI